MKVLLRRSRQDGTAGRRRWRRSTDAKSRASSIPASPLHGGGPGRRDAGTASTWRSISRRPTPSSRTCRRSRHAASTSSSARPAGSSTRRAAQGRSPTPASASLPRRISRPASCCSRRSWRRRRSCSRAQPEFGAWLHEAHHAAKKDAPSGTALHAQARDGERRLRAADRRSSTRAGFIPGTHTVGFDGPAETITLTHTARDRARLCARRADGRAVGPGPTRLVHDARRARDMS